MKEGDYLVAQLNTRHHIEKWTVDWPGLLAVSNCPLEKWIAWRWALKGAMAPWRLLVFGEYPREWSWYSWSTHNERLPYGWN